MHWTSLERTSGDSSTTHLVLTIDYSSEGLEVPRLKSADLLELEETILGDREPSAFQGDELLKGDSPVEVQELRVQFLYQLLRVGGWTAAVLLAFRLVVVPLLGAGSSPVALVLAIAVGVFLVLCGLGALIHELRQ